MKKLLLAFIGFMWVFLCLGQSPFNMKVIKGDIYLNLVQVPDSSNLEFLRECFGKPNRLVRYKVKDPISNGVSNWEKHIYDEHGIVISMPKNSKNVAGIDIFFESTLKKEPKKHFTGRLSIDGIPIDMSDSKKEIEKKLKDCTLENNIGPLFFLFDENFQCILSFSVGDQNLSSVNLSIVPD